MDYLQLPESTTEKSTPGGQILAESKQRSSSDNINSPPTSDNTCIPKDFSCIYNKDLLPALSGEDTTKSFFQELVNILLSYVCKSFRRSSKVLDFHHPHQLREGLEGFSLELPDQPENLEQLLVDCRDTLKYGVKTGHPRFFNQLSSGLDVIGLAGEWLTSTANTNMFTYEVSPVFILMEEVLLRKMQEIVGWSEEEGDGDGVFCPGGTMSNLYSVLLARYHFFPEVKTKGMTALPRLILFTSAHSHYSVKKSAAVLGIGSENVVLVKCNDRGKMIPAELESSIITAKDQGCVPFYVNATAGTTVYGAFDPLNAIADICESHGLWLHVDAAWGGGLLMSKRHRVKLQGIERAWSVTWNPHKMMGAPLQCSAILVKKRGLLKDCNQMCAEYLFQTDKHYDTSYDTGDKTIQCGRHVDVFKLWLMWKAKGSEGFESQVNKCLENAEHLFDKLKQRPDFELVFKSKPEHSNVCFWYIPPSLRNMPPGSERNRRLHEVAPKIKAKMMEQGMAMIGYQPLGDKVNFFRCVFSNPATQTEDVDYLLEEIAALGHDMQYASGLRPICESGLRPLYESGCGSD
ncbi:glutamate decarboxylase 1-like [Salvelinus namaycush]|uniref:Glutamate decarboxylase 1-like n=1 Tax=Salvelinus namaycush TaxID=8040 RepID=A0A8U1BTD8_SALNM|nr:glutamate decarboxylase 1-like [Salvelinus namaycush]